MLDFQLDPFDFKENAFTFDCFVEPNSTQDDVFSERQPY